ncbi:tRNA preQ1(34) S-adenosylmethionine ribosyltransferase-isomerase QueA [Rickettsiales bacterium]|nr:tRNA preQ1(34) S-adenosylmethionine ribosyltransferase-isomerase QueA [Rickettsiales bacterium]
MFNISDYNFNLPKKLIAQQPINNKEDTKMMVFDCNQQMIHQKISDIINYINKDDVVIFNDVKVIKAKLSGIINNKNSKLEVNLDQEISCKENIISWQALCKPAKKIKDQDIIYFSDNFYATIKQKLEDGFIILEFPYDKKTFFDKINQFGEIPLPPYIKRVKNDKNDQKNYQTIYAKNGSAVAAPTAGLHFNKKLLSQIKNKGAKICYVTLNVGAGTFLPVRCDKITDHKMHKEYYEISPKTATLINNAKSNNKKIIAIGTTTVRAIESSINSKNQIIPKIDNTEIFIYPSYKFKIIDILLTNFHLPKSTLLMLVSAFIGKNNTDKLYQCAIDNNYRFFSYGDCSLLFKKNNE